MSPRRERGAEKSAYKPYTNTRRPGGPPEYQPQFRVLVHRRHEDRWRELPTRVGLEQAQHFHDHVAISPGEAPDGVSVSILKGSAGKPQEEEFSATRHWRVPGHAARLDYQFNLAYEGGAHRDPHAVVRIIAISSQVTRRLSLIARLTWRTHRPCSCLGEVGRRRAVLTFPSGIMSAEKRKRDVTSRRIALIFRCVVDELRGVGGS